MISLFFIVFSIEQVKYTPHLFVVTLIRFFPSNYFPLVTRSVFAHSVYTYRIECYFEDTPYLHLGNGQSIPAKTTGRIEFTFNPQEPRSYHEEVELVINGIYKETLEVKGKGVEMKVSYPSYFLHYRAVVLKGS